MLLTPGRAGVRDGTERAGWNQVRSGDRSPRLGTSHAVGTRANGQYADPMPELPEVEAWVRELAPLVGRAPVESARAEHVATLKSFDPPPSALAGRRLAGADRRGKNLLLPTDDGELVLRVHLMSAGRLRYHPPGGKPPKTSMFRVRFGDGGQLVLTEAGKKRRAGVWLLSPAALDAELAHLGPDALAIDPPTLAPILRADRRQLHPLLRDQRALAGIGRAHANEILWRAQLSPFRLSTELSDDEVAHLAESIRADLTRALDLRCQGKGDQDVYVIHGRFGQSCPRCADTLRRVDFEEHTITYCPSCQTGGRILKDRRLSRLLR
jgi:formamidopyrimidine-DNA glycosylase